MKIKTADLFDLSHTLAAAYLARSVYPWEVLKDIKDAIISIGNSLPKDEYDNISENVWVHKTAKIAPTAFIGSPTIIGAETEVRHCAFIRESALIGSRCVIGNSVEIKNAILFDNVEAPHFNYVGDSVLGYRSHMGAGAVTSNVKSDKTPVVVKCGGINIETGSIKCGAFLGDYAEVGCNCVLNPGTVIGRNTIVYPTACVRGVIPENSICKTGSVTVEERVRDK
ncbi:MAG: UDP-N-acetylglucosamine pyrophosphorylase [Clostridia bacterium]|nr:UDP-N-acetylglucosamine pyrophosphorylase [Clostridia bacterium]